MPIYGAEFAYGRADLFPKEIHTSYVLELLGHGWSLGYKNLRLQESMRAGLNWQINTYGGTFGQRCVESNGNRLVTVTMPDGHVERFAAEASPRCSSIVATIDVNLVYRSLDNTGATLEQLDYGQLRLFNGDLVDLSDPTPADPRNYRLTTAEGEVYVVEQSLGVRRITDTNGNSLSFNENGITHSSGIGIHFTRDNQGRITSITGPDEEAVHYRYSATGDLREFTDRENHPTSFTYLADHYLQDIVDARGVRAIRNEYDDQGRLIAQIGPEGERVVVEHSVAERTSIIRDVLGHATVYVYNERGNVLRETNALNETVIRSYDDRDNLLSQTDPLGNTTSWTYDTRGNKLTETDPQGRTTTWTYSERNQVLTQTDADGVLVSETTYSNNGNPTLIANALNQVTNIGYDARGNMTQVTDPLGQASLYAYDTLGNQTRITQANGQITDYTYDENGNPLTETTYRTDAHGQLQSELTQHSYDKNGKRVQTTDSLGHITRREYNGIGKAIADIDALGRRTEYEYDPRGNQVEVRYPDGNSERTGYDLKGNKTSQTDRAGRTTFYRYDAAGRLLETEFPDGSVTQIRYDGAGRQIETIDQAGHSHMFVYNTLGQLIQETNAGGHSTQYGYDSRGNQTTLTNAKSQVTQYEYDLAGRRNRTIFPDSTAITVVYDAVNRKTHETNQNGHTTQFVYSTRGYLSEVIDASGNSTYYTYDEQGNKLTQTDAEGRTTRWAYDALGRQKTRTLPLGQQENFVYDAVGNLISHTDFNGQTTSYEYDLLNREVRKTFFDGLLITTTYSLNGQISTRSDAQGEISQNYDVMDRLIHLTNSSGQAIEYSYDSRGNKTTLDSGSQSINYHYNDISQLETVTDAQGVTHYHYDPVGNLEQQDFPNGLSTRFDYDSQQRLVTQTTRNAADLLIESYHYSLDPAGLRLVLQEHNGRISSWGYDELNRLTLETIQTNTGTNTRQWSFDKVGNRLTQVSDGATTSYSYDVNDRLLTETSLVGTTTYGYDANGNTLSQQTPGGSTSYSWNAANLLASVATQTGNLSYSYDANGNRRSKTEGGVTTDYLVDPNLPYAQVLQESRNGALEALYTYGHRLIQRERQGEAHFYHHDGLGSTRDLSNASGSFTDNYNYQAYGELESQTGTSENHYLFTGEQFDAGLGQYYLRARYYNPSTGRFPGMDSWMGRDNEPVTLNKYLYNHADPINRVDPSGQMSLVTVGISINAQVMSAGVNLLGAGALLYGSSESSPRVTLWDSMVMMQISHDVPAEVYLEMERAEAKAMTKTHKKPENHHTIPMYLCGERNQSPLANISYVEHSVIHAGLGGMAVSVEAVGTAVSEALNIPFKRRRTTAIQTLGRHSAGRASIANTIEFFYNNSGTGAYGGGEVMRSFSKVRSPFIKWQSWCNAT